MTADGVIYLVKWLVYILYTKKQCLIKLEKLKNICYQSTLFVNVLNLTQLSIENNGKNLDL